MAPLLQQAGAIPYRLKKGQVEYLLITSSSGNWIFPKGMIDPGDTAPETALKESKEEGGILGELEGEEPIGHYRYEKWGRELIVAIYLLRVSHLDKEWEEAAYRSRRWCRFKEASRLLHKEAHRALLVEAHALIKT